MSNSGKGIKIRPVRPEDAADLYHNVTHPAVARNILLVPSMEFSQALDWIQNHSLLQPRLVAEVGGRAVGSITLQRSDNPRRAHGATLGMNVHPDFWGRGIGSALMAAILDVADNWLNLKRVELEVFTDNERAYRLYQKAGFVAEGTRRRAVFGAGRWADARVMARIAMTGTERREVQPPAPSGERGEAIDLTALIIRPFHPDDLDNLYELLAHPAVARTTAQLPYQESSYIRDRRLKPHPGLHRLVAELDGRVIGEISVFQPQNPRMMHVGQIGMAVHPDCWGQGIGTRLVTAILDLADNWLNLKRVELDVNTDNAAAIRLYEKTGFEIEGTKRYHLYGDGRWADSHFMARLRFPHEMAEVGE